MRALRILPFSLEGLPHVPWTAVSRTQVVARARAALPHELSAFVRGIGWMKARPTWMSFGADGKVTGESFALEAQDQIGRLVIATPLALRLVTAVLGAPPAVGLRPLGRAERGTLAAIVVAFLDAAGVGGRVRLGLAPAASLPPGDSVGVDLQISAASGSGTARLELPMTMLPARSGKNRIDPAAVTPLVVFELARTTLAGADLAGASPGDAVVFEGFSALAEDVPWPVVARFGVRALPAALHPDGRLEGRGALTRNESEESRMSADTLTETKALPTLSSEASAALSSAPVEIVAEIGRLTLRGEELVGLIEGGVLSLGARRPGQVALRAGGRLWAMGELVAIDDELGVRITELVRP